MGNIMRESSLASVSLGVPVSKLPLSVVGVM